MLDGAMTPWREVVRVGVTVVPALLAACGGAMSNDRDAAPGGTGPVTGSGGANGSGDGGQTAATLGLTACRDLSPPASSLAVAASAPVFLLVNPYGASVVTQDGWRVPRTFTGQIGTITDGAISADGSWGATIGSDLALRFWRTSDGSESARLQLTAVPTLLAASPVADLVAMADQESQVTVVAPAGATVRWRVQVGEGPVAAIQFLPDGRSLLVATHAALEWRNVATGELMRSLSARSAAGSPTGGGGSVDAGAGPAFAGPIAITKDGNTLAFATVVGFEIQARVVRASDLSAVGGPIARTDVLYSMALTNDGKQVILGTDDGAFVYDAASAALVRSFLPFHTVLDLAVSADGTMLAVDTAEVSFYRLADGALVHMTGQTGFIWFASFATDGRLAIPGVAGPTQIWDPARGTPLRFLEEPPGNGGTVGFTPSDQIMMMTENLATFWDADQGTVVDQVTFASTEVNDGLPFLVFTPDGRTLISGGSPQARGQIRFWDRASGALLRAFSAHAGGITDLAITSRGDILASAGYEGELLGGVHPLMNNIKLWDVASGALLATFEGHTGRTAVEFSKDGDLLMSADDFEGRVSLWSVPGGQLVRDLSTGRVRLSETTSNGYGYSIAMSPDGRLAASAGFDWTITERGSVDIAVWRVADGVLVAHLLGLSDAGQGSIVWSPDGSMIAAGASGGMRVWCLTESPALASASAGR